MEFHKYVETEIIVDGNALTRHQPNHLSCCPLSEGISRASHVRLFLDNPKTCGHQNYPFIVDRNLLINFFAN